MSIFSEAVRSPYKYAPQVCPSSSEERVISACQSRITRSLLWRCRWQATQAPLAHSSASLPLHLKERQFNSTIKNRRPSTAEFPSIYVTFRRHNSKEQL